MRNSDNPAMTRNTEAHKKTRRLLYALLTILLAVLVPVFMVYQTTYELERRATAYEHEKKVQKKIDNYRAYLDLTLKTLTAGQQVDSAIKTGVNFPAYADYVTQMEARNMELKTCYPSPVIPELQAHLDKALDLYQDANKLWAVQMTEQDDTPLVLERNGLTQMLEKYPTLAQHTFTGEELDRAPGERYLYLVGAGRSLWDQAYKELQLATELYHQADIKNR